MVKWLGLRARGHRFESGQDVLGSFRQIFQVIVGWCPTRPEFFLLSQSFRGHVRVVFMLFGTTVKYLRCWIKSFRSRSGDIHTASPAKRFCEKELSCRVGYRVGVSSLLKW